MIIEHINSKWSMPRRLALIAAIFLVPSLVQLFLFAEQKLDQRAIFAREAEGGDLSSAIWAKMSGADRSQLRDSNAELFASAKDFGVESSLAAFENAKTEVDRVHKGVELLDRVAAASGMAVASSPNSYHAQDVFIQRLGGVKQALADLADTIATPSTSENRTDFAIDYAVLQRTTKKLSSALNQLKDADTTGDVRRALGDTDVKLLAKLDEIASKLTAADYQRSLIGDLKGPLVDANLLVAELANEMGGVFDQLADANVASADRSLYLTVGLLVAATILALVMVALLSKGISSRLSALIRAMEKLSHNDLAVSIPHLSDRNENGLIADALSHFKKAMTENKQMTDAAVEAAKQQQEQNNHYALEHERFMDAFTSAAERIASGDFTHRITEKVIPEYEAIINQMNLMMGQLASAQAAKLEAENQINTVVASLGTSLSELAQGNLETSVYAEFAPEFAKLKSDFNSAAAQLKSTIELVKKGAGSIRLGTEEISQASDDLSRRTENQAASLEQTAAAVKEITDTVNKTARGATHARETVSVAKADAEKGGEVVRKAIAAMNGIETSSKQISQIIGVIDEIAFQTNLLALNAGVEAARAGDAGRGFAVVASEVRALAQRSAEAAKEIKGLISASTGQVTQGVQLVGETGQALTRIVSQVAEINTIVSDIATSANEQAHGLEQVNTAVNEMDQVTQQNAAMVEQATAATQTLAQQTEELVRLVSRFKTGDDTVVEMASRRESAKPMAHVVRPASVKKAAAGAGRRQSAQPVDAGWEEF
jgi:methyl-accepting chemotaxis protein